MSKIALHHLLTYSRYAEESLNCVAKRAIALCGLSSMPTFHDPLIRTFWSVVENVEKEGAKLHVLGAELTYHNRVHVKDTLNTLAYLLSTTAPLEDEDRLLALIAMAGHDLYHEGKTNDQLKVPQEEVTARLLEESCLFLLTAQQKKKVLNWIVGTNPDQVLSNHVIFKKQNKNCENLIQILINESDIAASLNPSLSFGLTRSLLIERGAINPSSEEINKLYKDFVSNAHISSVAGCLSI